MEQSQVESLELRLLNEHQIFLEKRQDFLVQWCQAQDVILTLNMLTIIGLACGLYYVSQHVKGEPR